MKTKKLLFGGIIILLFLIYILNSILFNTPASSVKESPSMQNDSTISPIFKNMPPNTIEPPYTNTYKYPVSTSNSDPLPTGSLPPITNPSKYPIQEAEFPNFPWPPPKGSASLVIPLSLITKSGNEISTLGNLSDILVSTLDQAGYVEKSFFCVPDGYAIVTRIEQINSDGSPKIPGRWDINPKPLREFSLQTYLNALFLSRSGLFRIVVFVTTTIPFKQSDCKIGREEGMSWLENGTNKLPEHLFNRKFTSSYTTTALIYEFKKPETSDPILNIPSHLTGKDHLIKARIIK